MSLKLDKEKEFFYLEYVHPPAHGHSSADIVELAKQEDGYGVGTKGDDTTDRALRVLATSRLVTLRRSTRRARSSEIQIKKETSATLNGESGSGYLNPVKIKDDEDDNNHVFSDQEGEDDGKFKERATHRTTRPERKVKIEPSVTLNREHNCHHDGENPVKTEVDGGVDELIFSDQESVGPEEDESNYQEHDMLGSTTSIISPAQGSIISQLTHSLLFEQNRFRNPNGSNALREDLEGLMYFAKRLKSRID
ncbi:unnamed protein product [Ambrosiozyma monospora]|uniref:Unnamed protein product n=1 Tax=Ambrosiozyma monospora TaxID=43982 RepID=A0ACB5U885_AMBMO|nr:unnamed protein product [Ambrosiozyma monospora]